MQQIIVCLILCIIAFNKAKTVSICLQESSNYQDKYMKPILISLENKGYRINKGYLYWIRNETKHGGNPASSYGMWNFPNISSNLKPSPETPMAMLFHSSDAILFTGCTPPNSTYFGFENYVYTKYNPSNNPNASMSIVFSSTGASINQYVLNISNSSSSYSYSFNPFNAITSIITSGDQITFNDIYDEYKKYNITNIINNNYIPSEYFNFIPYNFTKYNYSVLTYPGSIDSFMPVARIMNHLDENEWIKYTTSKQPCYLITAENLIESNITQPRKPYTDLYIRNHTSSRDEFMYLNDFEIYINDSINYFENEYNMELIEIRSVINYNIAPHYYGFNCYKNNWNCQGDLRDEQYWGTHNGTNVLRHIDIHPNGIYNLLNNSYFLMIGLNHVNTNFTIYDNIIMYYMENKLIGLYEPIDMIDNTQYNNSCNKININTSITHNVLSKFYMIQIARPQHCLNINLPGMCMDTNIVSDKNHFAMYTRNLLNLETLTRPSQQQIIPDRFLHFRIH